MSLPSNFGRDFFACQAKRTGRLWYVSFILDLRGGGETFTGYVREPAKTDDYGWPTTSPSKGETLAHGKLSRAVGKWVIDLMQNVKHLKNTCCTMAYLFM
jgi:hypothetical protein